jgi:malonyl-CoA O-methyltransferase
MRLYGAGSLVRLAAPMLDGAGARTVAGCDFSEGMLAEARRKSPRCRLFRHDMTQPLGEAVPDDSTDIVLFSLTLEHVADPRTPLAEARRILRPNGCIVIIEIHPFLSLSGLAAHFNDGEALVRMPAYPHQFGDYLAAFRDTGLAVTDCREWRPADVGNPEPLQSVSRGPDFPLTLEFHLR